MIEFIVFAIFILVATATAAYTLTLLDRIVHVNLYSYGLQFSPDWANPYWTVLRVTLALLGLVAVLTSVNVFFTYRKLVYQRKLELKASERARAIPARGKEVVQPMPIRLTPAPKPEARPVPAAPTPPARPSVAMPTAAELIHCSHCGKTFSQPLRMLDFHSERPKIVNICPFCNEVVETTRPQEETEQTKRGEQKRKRNDKAQEVVVASTSGE